ncbi:hypothetical protein HPB52_023502 [Rhipicephalus sanguineus]|uniref:Uncharacterized protein n=1 Tax=Rhipicephalus sanguineus TaxID=34632 RepID=A0A9D4YQZ4_RHISA|nr:hypothetical protein HPB52_023502 [Rhipicephalus sanguineus]
MSVATAKVRRRLGQVKITNWNAFRQDFEEEPIQTIAEWSKGIREAYERATKAVERTDITPEIDNYLLRLWEPRRSMTKRWRRQKGNRKLKRKIAALTIEAEQYAQDLSKQNWNEFCDSLKGTLGTAKTWALLRNMIDPNKSETENNKTLHRIAHNFQGNDAELLGKIRERYIGSVNIAACTDPYRGQAQSITKTYQNRKNAAYVDVATYENGKDAVVTMIDAQLKEKVSASLKNWNVSDAEEAAVALAVAEGKSLGSSPCQDKECVLHDV